MTFTFLLAYYILILSAAVIVPLRTLSQWPIRVTTLRASEAAAQCIVTGPVCLFVVVWMCVFVGLLPR